MSPSNRGDSRRALLFLMLVVFLVLLVVGLGVAYYYLSKPAEIEQAGTRDRNYLFSIYGFEGDLLRRPSSVDVDGQGNIYVADTGKKRIVVFDADGNFVTFYGDFGQGTGQIWEPIDVAIAPDGRSYVLDKGLKKVVIYDPTRTPVHEISFPDEDPLSITVGNDLLFVTAMSGVLISDLDGNPLTGYISRGKEPGQFDMPGGVAVGEDGTLYVADSFNYRVQAISTDGEPLWQYGTPIPADQAVTYQGQDRKFGLPASIAVDENGFLYVVDGTNSEIVVLDSAGEFIENLGDVGHADGTFYYPDGIAYGGGRLVVADKFNDRVEVFSIPTAVGSSQTARFVPYALLLLLLPLGLLFLRRRPRYVMTPEFISAMYAHAEGPVVAKSLGTVNASSHVADIGRRIESFRLSWKERPVKAESAASLAERYHLDEGQADALDVALRLRGKRILLAEDTVLRAAADELGIATLAYQEIADTVVKPTTIDSGGSDQDDESGPSED
ncbi:MAG: NHL repeat-containing protein [Thermoleophilia bacterium]|nr:NHL repeat-containing protein [Thermoleophilia bacterium]